MHGSIQPRGGDSSFYHFVSVNVGQVLTVKGADQKRLRQIGVDILESSDKPAFCYLGERHVILNARSEDTHISRC